MVAEKPNPVTTTSQLAESWALVDELGEYSLRLKLAAIAAHQSLGLPVVEEEHPHDRTAER